MSKQPKVSFIIITLNRGTLLVNTMKDVLAQNYPDFELIVVDQSDQTHPEVTAYLQQLKGKKHAPLNYIKVDWKGQPRARNLGAEEAHGEILVYTDDDVHVEPDFVQLHVDAYSKDPKIGGTTGAVITPHDASPIGGSFVTWLGGIKLNRGAHTPEFIDIAFGCNMSFKKSVWKEVGGFNNSMQASNLEEAFISMMLKKHGYKVYYEPKAVTLHFINPTGGTRNYNKKVEWYYPFFFNQFYFYFWFFPKIFFPLFVFTRLRPLLVCMFFYGKGKPSAMAIPFRALKDAWKTYYKEAHA